MRKGPKPLHAHIGMAMSYWAHNIPENSDGASDMPESLQRMLRGVHKYQMSDFVPKKLPLDEIWRGGQVTVNAIPGHDYHADNPVFMLVPSMINRADILDLMHGRSMLRFFAQNNINAYLLDWGEVCDDPAQGSVNDIIVKRLEPALSFVRTKEGCNIHVLGYCMGGTLLSAAATRGGDILQSLVFLAAPWDFHAGSQSLLNRMKFWAPSVLPSLTEKNYLSQDWLQMLFASLDSGMAVEKFSRFLDMAPGSEEEQLFIAVEDWLNNGVDLPASVASDCIHQWFLSNNTMHKKWQVDGQVIDPATVNVPSLVVASSKDNLVEYDMASGLADMLPNVRVFDPQCGHIGLIAGRNAVDHVWAHIAAWVHENS